MDNLYDDQFFSAISGGARRSALRVLPVVVDMIKPRSVVDVGCGTGDWLSTLTEITACEVVGLDGDYVPIDLLAIPHDSFIPTDLSQPFALDRPFDLAMSLEVAEHLPPSRASGFVHDLTHLASAVLFAAAIPNQGGVGHINEQWQSYWIDLFTQNGFEAWEVIRPDVWNDNEVAFCYRQNMFLFVDPSAHGHRPELAPTIADAVHPELLRLAVNAGADLTLREVLTQLPSATGRSLTHHLGRIRPSPRR